MERYLTTDEAAEVLRMTAAGLRNRLYRAQGDEVPPYVELGRRRLFPAAELEAWMRGRMRGGSGRRPGRPTKAEEVGRTRAPATDQ